MKGYKICYFWVYTIILPLYSFFSCNKFNQLKLPLFCSRNTEPHLLNMKLSTLVSSLLFLVLPFYGWSQVVPKKVSTAPVQANTTPSPLALIPLSSRHAAFNRKNTGNNGQINLVWGKPYKDRVDENSPEVEFLNCKGALYTHKNHNLPQIFRHIKLNIGSTGATATIVNSKYVLLTPDEIKVLSPNQALISPDVIPSIKVVSEYKELYANVSFIPIRKNAVTGSFEKLVSFSIELHPTKEITKAPSSPINFASSSVLNSGSTWFRIGVTKDGIYRLNYSMFKKAGIDMSSLVPANIRIYGNGGAMLPISNKAYRPDDLIENAIYVSGQSHPVFESKDYVLFYGQGPTIWAYTNSDGRFHHTVNLYSDTTFYFVNVDLGSGKRISNESSLVAKPTDTVTTFDDYAYHELDAVNLIQSGNEWMGEEFEATTQYTFSFNFPNISGSSPYYVNAAIASLNCNLPSSYAVGPAATICTIPGVPCQFDETYAAMNTCNYTAVPSGSNISVTVTKITPSAVGWLYYLEANARRQLIMGSQTQMEFRDSKSVGNGNISLFSISSVSSIQVWDITNPQNVSNVALSNANGNYQFILPSDTLKQYLAFNTKTFDSNVTYFGRVGNQNLHGLPQADMIIVTNLLYLPQAEQLAKFHTTHDKLHVDVVTTQQVYNEYSSGRQDPTAMRDFAMMLYNRATNYATSPKYLLLFGDGSFDPKHRISGNTNFVVSYESNDSFDPVGSYVSDDYFALLDTSVTTVPEEGEYNVNLAVGRITADNVTEAQTCVNKVISYETPSGEALSATNSCCNTQQYNLGSWRNTVCFIAHDGDDDQFQDASEGMAAEIDSNYRNLNVNKIYLDAYQMVQTPGGPRYPSVNIAIDNQMNQGLLIYNYEGHGGPTGLAVERVLDLSDISSWTNINALPLFFNGSCAFGEWDNPLQVSGGELSVTLPTGGVIGMMTATRAVYLSFNVTLNDAFVDLFYSPLPDGSLPRMGDLLAESKNISGGTNVNNLSFSLIGDPAVRLNYPKYNVVTTSINSQPVTKIDTLKALAKVTVSGYVADSSKQIMTSFNGLLTPTVYDKYADITTLSNLGADQSPSDTFALQNNILYKGLVSVNNGKFSFTFVMPKDILYYYGFGKISYYAENQVTDATGNYENIVVGGTSPTAHNNGLGPKIRLYINDSNFVYGGLTNQNPSLYAIVFDSNGINTSATSIGHNITAVLDNNTANTYDLTNYYQPSLNSYQKGTITFPLSSLSSGTHIVSLRVWNVYDNTSVASTEFNVEPQSNLQLQHVLNYPNPFTTHTQFYFEINQVCDQLDVQIQIFSVSGKLVKNILTFVKTDSFRSEPIDWDGRDEYGDKIGKGVYIYHIRVRTSNGSMADTYQKLVIL